jgi:parvulin-like peptidyl-prolyl isomerase
VLGWFTPDDLVPEFREAIQGMAPGEVGPILQGDGGFYVVKLLSHEAARTATLEEVRPKLRDFLMNQRMEEEYRGLIDRLSGEIYVDLRSGAAPSP